MSALLEAETETLCMDDPEYAEAVLNAVVGRGPNSDLPEARCRTADLPSGLVTLVAGAFAADVAHVFAGARVADYFTASDARRHVWYCWFASDPAGQERRSYANAEAIFQRLTTAKDRDLIVAAYGVCPAGLPAMLGKCGPKARSPDFYQTLLGALARGDLGAKMLRHAEALDDALVFNVAALPTHLQSKPLFDALRKGQVRDADFAHACWTIARLEALDVPGGVKPILRSGNLREAMTAALATLPFPPPPWAGTDLLRPLVSLDAIQHAGKTFGNCLGSEAVSDHVVPVVRGLSYFYEWCGDEAGVLQFDAFLPLGWHLEEGRGRDNAKLSPSTWILIKRTLASWPDLAPIWIDSDGDTLGVGFFRYPLF